MPQHYRDAIEETKLLIDKLEGFVVPDSESFPDHVEFIQDLVRRTRNQAITFLHALDPKTEDDFAIEE